MSVAMFIATGVLSAGVRRASNAFKLADVSKKPICAEVEAEVTTRGSSEITFFGGDWFIQFHYFGTF